MSYAELPFLLKSSHQGSKANGKTLGITSVVTTMLSMVFLSAHGY